MHNQDLVGAKKSVNCEAMVAENGQAQTHSVGWPDIARFRLTKYHPGPVCTAHAAAPHSKGRPGPACAAHAACLFQLH